MGILSVVCGILGVLGVVQSFSPGLFVAGVALGLAAMVLGTIERRRATGKLGVAMGLAVVVGAGAWFVMTLAGGT